jgi:hypothetical protein
MNSQEIWIPYLITHLLTLFLIFICYKWPKIGKISWALIFLAAGIFNLYSVISDPQQYVNTYGQHAIPLYKKFIFGFFRTHTLLFVALIASGQIVVGLFLFLKKTPFKIGILGGIIFLAAISPLGIGAAFPSTVLMAFSLILMYIRYTKQVHD